MFGVAQLIASSPSVDTSVKKWLYIMGMANNLFMARVLWAKRSLNHDEKDDPAYSWFGALFAGLEVAWLYYGLRQLE